MILCKVAAFLSTILQLLVLDGKNTTNFSRVHRRIQAAVLPTKKPRNDTKPTKKPRNTTKKPRRTMPTPTTKPRRVMSTKKPQPTKKPRPRTTMPTKKPKYTIRQPTKKPRPKPTMPTKKSRNLKMLFWFLLMILVRRILEST